MQTSRALQRMLGSAAFLESLPIGVYCCDRDGVIRHFNRRAAELWGRAPRIGDTDQRFCGSHKLFRPDGRLLPHDATPMADALRTGTASCDQRVVIERPDGARLTALVNIDPLFDEDGGLVGAVNCFQDISELARATDELQRSKEDLEDFFENGAVGLHIVGSDGTILRANKAELELLGYSRSEYVGRHISEFHVDQPVLCDILARLGRGECLDKYPARLRAKDGSIKHVVITSSGLFRDGEFVHTRCFTSDVTEAKRAEERMRESEQRFQDILEAMPAAIYTTDAKGKITFYNRAAVELSGRRPELGTDEWCVTWRLSLPDGTPLPHDQCPMAVALREQQAITGAETVAERPDGSRVLFIPYPTPLFDKDGRLMGAVNMLVDVTERHEAEVDAAHLAAIVASSDDAIISKTLDGEVRSWNAGATRLFGYDASEMIGQTILRLIPPELHAEEEQILARLRRGDRIEHFETVRLTKDGRRINVSLTVSPVRDKSGKVIGASKVARDITERKQAEELQQLLISELDHRVKNTLAIVQSMANQTVRLAKSPADFVSSFSGRIQSLAHAHDLLTQNSWQGADVLPLVRDQLLLNGAGDDQIALSGPAVTLDAQPALHLALILHELGTNARKYGALSVPEGRLSVNWTVHSSESRTFLLQWQESGGPAIKAPSARGFGTTLIERSLAAHGGEACVHYRAEGVTCEITLPLPERARRRGGGFMTAAPIETSPAGTDRLGAPSGIRGSRILVVEDEQLVAMDVAETLSAAGCVVVGPAATLEKAQELIGAAEFDAALLDANLNGRPVDGLAAALTRLNVPFAFLTGYGREGLPQAFRHAAVIKKPFTRNDAFEVIGHLLQRGDKVVRLRTGA